MHFEAELREYLEGIGTRTRTRGHAIERYAFETYLVRLLETGDAKLSGLGRAFLRLRGRDAVQLDNLLPCLVRGRPQVRVRGGVVGKPGQFHAAGPSEDLAKVRHVRGRAVLHETEQVRA